MRKLLDKIKYKVTDKECWEITSHKSRRAGYPVFRINGKLLSAHRIIYEEEKGSIPEGLLVLHSCDNRECINPDHLRIGTYKDNLEDVRRRYGLSHIGKNSKPPVMRGSKNPISKLKEKDVLDIRKKVLLGETQKSLAEYYGVSRPTISRIISGHKWGWLKS